MFDPSDWPLLAMLALPLAVAGVMVRARGRRSLERATATATARRSLRDLAPGVVAFDGTWRAVSSSGGGRGVIEQDGAAAIIDRGAGAPAISDGARVLCHGVVRGDGPDPRGGGYRGAGRLPLVDATGAGDFVTTDVERFARAQRVARRDATLGAILVALAVAVVVAGVAVWLQALDQLGTIN
jgi:hypothetical protein